MDNIITNSSPRTLASLGCVLLLALRAAGAAPAHEGSAPGGTVAMEVIGQALILSPQSAIQFGYLSRVPGLETIFSGAPENESTALLTFYNDTVTTRSINNGPLRVVNRTGTAIFYLNLSDGGDFQNPDTFRAGAPVMVADLTHQVVLDTVLNTFITEFDLTITWADEFKIGGRRYRLGKRGEKLTWVVYGRAKTDAPGFAIAGYGLNGGH